MILEHAVLPVVPDREADFEAAFAVARPLIEVQSGCLGVALHRSLETPNAYLLLVHFYDPFPTVEHFVEVQSAQS